MKLPVSWLAEYVDPVPDADVLAERLTMSGLEVEELSRPDVRLVENLVVARITELARHPGADRLSLCQVDDGSEVRQVVCGATNMQAGDHVVLAKPGAVLPAGMKIKKSKIRGEHSHGMLCSASELGVSDDHDGIIVLDVSADVGTPAARLLGLDEHVLEVAVTPNRGDCLSVRGLAREVSAVCGGGLSDRFSERAARPAGKPRFTIAITSEQDCSMYRGVEVQGVTIGPSPAWLAARLAACGLRPINNVVDVTNLILLEIGQPLHAFDADLLVGRTIAVRSIDRDTSVDTLDDESRMLIDGDLVICDDDGPVAVAGVMGGARTAVHDGTRNLFLESARFRPTRVRATSRRLGLISESSYRFERGVDPAMVEEALLRAAHLIAELAGGEVCGGVAVGGEDPASGPRVELRPARVERLLGVAVESGDMAAVLGSLGADVEDDGESMIVTVPSHRGDLTREVDLIEEVARVRGYDTFPDQLPDRTMSAATVPPLFRLQTRLRERLAAVGLTEAVGLAFCSRRSNELFPGLHDEAAASVVIRNPMRADEDQMRRSILPGLFEAQAFNARNGAAVVDLFAMGRTFAAGGGEGTATEREGEFVVRGELEVVGGLLSGPRRARGPGDSGPATFWDAKAVVEAIASAVPIEVSWRPCADRPEFHPKACASLLAGDTLIGYVGTVHPDVADELQIPHEINAFEVDTRKLLEYAPARSALRPIPRFPASGRDISLLVPESFLAGGVVRAVEELGEPLIERVFVFDEYVGEGIEPGHRALAFSIVYRSADRTLTDDEVSELHERVVARLVDELGVEVRA